MRTAIDPEQQAMKGTYRCLAGSSRLEGEVASDLFCALVSTTDDEAVNVDHETRPKETDLAKAERTRDKWSKNQRRFCLEKENNQMLQVWGRRSSFNVQKVMWLIGELSILHQHIPAGGQYGGIDTPQFLSMNPHGRVPVMRDSDGTVVWESHSILRYLGAKYGGDQYWNDTPGNRAEIDSWMDWCQSSLQPAFLTGVFWGFYRTPEAQRDLPAIAKSVALCAKFFQRLDQLLSRQPFIGGQSLSLADIPLGTHLYRYFSLDISRPSLPYVEAWYELLQQRSAFREHVMVPFDDLFGRLDF